MLIDTHCHLDAPEFDRDRPQVLQAALENGVNALVIPAVAPQNFAALAKLCEQYPSCFPAYGIHPLYTHCQGEHGLAVLSQYLQDEKVVAVGEIGLDYFVRGQDKDAQLKLFQAQLSMASTFQLPVILHVRGAIDAILKEVRRARLIGGIAHAFNGSIQQAKVFIDHGFVLGFGGAMTYERALKLREMAKVLPLDAIVLETDSPDIPPSWLGHSGRNSPFEMMGIAQCWAALRGMAWQELAEISSANACRVLPRLKQALQV